MYLHVSIYHTQKIHRRYVGPSANDSLSHQQLHFDCQRFRHNKWFFPIFFHFFC